MNVRYASSRDMHPFAIKIKMFTLIIQLGNINNYATSISIMSPGNELKQQTIKIIKEIADSHDK